MNRTASTHNYRRENNNYDFLAFKQIIFWLFFSLWFHLTKHSNSSLLLSLWSSSKYNCQNHQYCFLLSLFWGFELLIHNFLVGYYCKNAKFKIRGKKYLSNNASLEVSFFFFLAHVCIVLILMDFCERKKSVLFFTVRKKRS